MARQCRLALCHTAALSQPTAAALQGLQHPTVHTLQEAQQQQVMMLLFLQAALMLRKGASPMRLVSAQLLAVAKLAVAAVRALSRA